MLEDKWFRVWLISKMKIQLTVHLCSVLCREFRPTPWLKFLLESLVATLYNWSGFTLHLHIIYVCFPAYHILHGIERKLYRFKVFFLKTNVKNTRKPCWQKHGQDFSAGIFSFICLEGSSHREHWEEVKSESYCKCILMPVTIADQVREKLTCKL